MPSPVPNFAFNAAGKPQIGCDDRSLFSFGNLIRQTEQLILDLFGRGLLSGTTHTCLGQELCQMAVVRALQDDDDVVLSNHRNHGHFLTYSGDFLGLVAEIMGREAGVCGGYGGSQHMALRHFHSNGVQAGMTAIATGLALQRKQRGSASVVAVMVGDGTLGEGLLYESMNLAAIWKLPVLFVVENNGIAQTTVTAATVGGGNIAARGAAFGLKTWQIDDADSGFCAQVQGIVNAMREGIGPGMLVVETGRLGPHSKGDDLRPAQELERIQQRDPLAAMGRRLAESDRLAIVAANQDFLRGVEAAALASPVSTFAVVPSHALRPATAPVPALAQPAQAANVRLAINAALRTLLTHRPEVLVLGEDLHEPYGGAFKVTAGLSQEFAGRVISTPISEAGITGAGIGLALAGQRPVVEIMFADFMTLCMDQLYNHAVKFPGMFPDAAVPLLVRTPCGGRRGYGPTHSQSPENLLVSVPGLTVVYGSQRHNVGQLLVDAVTAWPNPTVFLEHKLLYGEVQAPGPFTALPAQAEDLASSLFPTLSSGPVDADIVLLSYGGMLPVVERVARQLREAEELSVRIVAPALLSPLPRQALRGALLGAAKVVVIEESHHQYGVGAEVLALLAESGFGGQVLRIGMPPVPIAAARSLEAAQLPDEKSILARILGMF